MPSVIYQIDPFADTVIVLKSPCRNFAPWDETPTLSNTDFAELEEEQSIRALSSEDEQAGAALSKKDKKAKRASAPRNSAVPSIPEANGERAEPSIAALSGEQELVHDPEPAASPWFRRTLTREEFIEASKDPSDGRHHISASDWDEEALFILLNNFHVRTRRVPATVIERDVRDWTTDVRRNFPIPLSYCRDLMLWICVSRVFHMSEAFKKATALAIKGSEGWIQTLDLPIHEDITCTLSTYLDGS
ncbi:hypothetical protein BU23DRAFT_575924 [Bimuria novae-zelandiae CBS 107.79]|uniref:BTB domain-containing protein n=1 Tax=Bimuria novae-zelandiae CBS 107.79 TaxID=1447943 RepID=A0A6A5UGW5_9PLEO|nr:hypothetical protein BU23DRAFT_575924 [Bimuria novae-zelandiae CBS 107.79]